MLPRALRLYRELNHRFSEDFPRQVCRALPLPIRQLQFGNGTEFSLPFAVTLQEAGVNLQHIGSRKPQQNAKVECITGSTPSSSGGGRLRRTS